MNILPDNAGPGDTPAVPRTLHNLTPLDERLSALTEERDRLADELARERAALDELDELLELVGPYMEGHPTRTVAEALALMAADAENGGAR